MQTERINNPQNKSGSCNLCEVSGGPIASACQDISSKVQDKLLRLVKANTEKEAKCLVGLIGFQIKYSSYFSVLL